MPSIWTYLRVAAVIGGSSAALLTGGIAHADPSPPAPAPDLSSVPQQLIASVANAPQILQNLATALGATPPAQQPTAPGITANIPGLTPAVGTTPTPAATPTIPGLGSAIPGLGTPAAPATPTVPAAPVAPGLSIPGLTAPATPATTAPATTPLVPQAKVNMPALPGLPVSVPAQINLPTDLPALANGGLPATQTGTTPTPAAAPNVPTSLLSALP